MMTEVYLSVLLRQFSVERIRQTLREAKRVISGFRPVTSDLVDLRSLIGARIIHDWRQDMPYKRSPHRDKENAAAPANAGQKQAPPAEHGEAMQRVIHKTSWRSERVLHGGKPGAGERA